MSNLMEKIQLNRSKLSELEKKVIDYILENSREVSNLTVLELSEKLYVSTATISRACIVIGFLGFKEMKFALKSHVKENEVKTYSGVEGTINRLKKEMHYLFNNIDYDKIEEVSKFIKNGCRVELFAVGSSLFVALELAKKLHFLGYNVSAKSDWDDLNRTAETIKEGDVAIFFSVTGETERIIKFATKVKFNKAIVISITKLGNSTLKELSDINLQTYIEVRRFQGFDFSSHFQMDIISELIVSACMDKEFIKIHKEEK